MIITMSVIIVVILLIYMPTTQLVNCIKLNLTNDYYSIIPEKFYQLDNRVELILMHNLIFKAIHFDDEMCEFTFQVNFLFIKLEFYC
jgi:hypothetical protein